MAYHRGGNSGAVAVSYSTNAMPTPLSSPSRRYSSGSTNTTVSGVNSTSTKLSSYRSSASSSFDRPSYCSSGSTSSSGYGSSHRSSYSSEYRRFCSPSRSLSVSSSSFSDTGSSSGGLSAGNYSSGRYSTLLSSSSSLRDRKSESRETLGSLATAVADINAKYSPANYVPNINGSIERSRQQSINSINGYGSSNNSSSVNNAIFGGNSSNVKNLTNELSPSDIVVSSSSIHGRPPRPTRRSPLSTLLNCNHAQPDGAATEVTTLNGDKNNNDDDDDDDDDDDNNDDYGNDNVSLNVNVNKNDLKDNDDESLSRINGIINIKKSTVTTELENGIVEYQQSEIPVSNGFKIINNTDDSNSVAVDGVSCVINPVCVSYSPINNSNFLLTNNEVITTNNNGQLDLESVGIFGNSILADKTTSRNSSVVFENRENPAAVSSSPEFNSSNSTTNSFIRKTLVSRPVGGNQISDNTSLPSTSRRGDTYSGNGSTSNGSNGFGNNSQSATAHQNIYRRITDQIEGSPTIRAPRNRLQTPRDERCGLNGLRNIGNTCFMNSVIQCLSNTRPLLEYLINEQYLADINTTTSSMKGALIKAFSQVIQELWEVGGDHVVNTTSLKSQIQRFAPRFMGYSQQDAQEFLRYLLEGLHEDVNRVTVKPQPIHTDIPEHYTDSQKAAESWKRYLRNEDSTIVDVFVGQLRSSLHCTACGHVSVTLDPFWDLSLPIPSRSGTVKLNQCLEHFTREEVLDGDEKPTCSKCQTRRKCTKSFSIQKFPKILVIHLKRFSPMERFRGKLNVLVDFPLTGLDLGAFSAPRVPGCTYNLYGVANHSGTTYSGHYTAYCKHPYSGEWHEYNDSRVSSIAARSVVSNEGYVLFYEQQPHSSNL